MIQNDRQCFRTTCPIRPALVVTIWIYFQHADDHEPTWELELGWANQTQYFKTGTISLRSRRLQCGHFAGRQRECAGPRYYGGCTASRAQAQQVCVCSFMQCSTHRVILRQVPRSVPSRAQAQTGSAARSQGRPRRRFPRRRLRRNHRLAY